MYYFGIPHKRGWSFVVRHNPRGRLVKDNVIEGKDTKEVEDEVDDNDGKDK